MGLRFRKSIKIAPGLKINLNKDSVSATVGKRGAHYTINSKGKRTASVGIPGTGLSYTSTSGGSSGKAKTSRSSANAQTSNHTPSDDDKKWYQKTGWIIFWLICFFPVGLFLMWKYSKWNNMIKVGISALFVIAIATLPSSDLEKIKLNADTSQNYDINEEIVIKCTTTPSNYDLTEKDFKLSGGTLKVADKGVVFSASEPGTYNIYAENSKIKSNELVITVEDKEAIAQAKAEEEAKKQAKEAQKKAEEEAKKQAEEAQKKAEAEAKKQAELEAQRQAELATKQAAQQSAATAPQQGGQSSASVTTPQETMVWISETGRKYHRNSGCSNMKSPTQVTKSEAEARGLTPCKKCY